MTAVVRAPQQGDSRFSPLPLRSQSPHGRDPCHNGTSRKSQRGSSSLTDNRGAASCSNISASNILSSPKRSSSTAATRSSSSSALPSSPSYLSSPDPKASPPDDIEFPAYDRGSSVLGRTQPAQDSLPKTSQPDDFPPEGQWLSRFTNMLVAGDDNSVEREPTQQVDYLSHDWKEEDVWTSWRYMTARRETHTNSARLENAAWRYWAKLRYHLETARPELISWNKEIDVTWLYGPLQTHSSTSTPPIASKSNSFLDKKSILKKRTASETIRQHSLSTRTLLKQAGDIVKAHSLGIYNPRPGPYTSSSDFVLSQSDVENALQASADSVCGTRPGSPSSADGRHITFNTEVAQFIAVEDDHPEYTDRYYGNYVDYYDDHSFAEDDSSSEDSLVMMKPSSSSRPTLSMRDTPRSSFSSSTIVPLPSTKLKFRSDSPGSEPEESENDDDDDDGEALGTGYSWWVARSESRPFRSSSVETLRPPKPKSAYRDNFHLDADQESESLESEANSADPAEWELDTNSAFFDASWFPDRKAETHRNDDKDGDQSSYQTSSGVFVPFGYEDEEEAGEDDADRMDYGIFGKVIDTVNTARDIAHVIWNVGWGN